MLSCLSQKVSSQEYYSSEMFNSTYPVLTSPAQPPGIKFAAKKFSSGIHASAANERFIAMRDANVDRRPFSGAPYAPSNAIVTTCKFESSSKTYPKLTTYPMEQPTIEPKAAHPAPRSLSLAQKLATR